MDAMQKGASWSVGPTAQESSGRFCYLYANASNNSVSRTVFIFVFTYSTSQESGCTDTRTTSGRLISYLLSMWTCCRRGDRIAWDVCVTSGCTETVGACGIHSCGECSCEFCWKYEREREREKGYLTLYTRFRFCPSYHEAVAVSGESKTFSTVGQRHHYQKWGIYLPGVTSTLSSGKSSQRPVTWKRQTCCGSITSSLLQKVVSTI